MPSPKFYLIGIQDGNGQIVEYKVLCDEEVSDVPIEAVVERIAKDDLTVSPAAKKAVAAHFKELADQAA